MKMEPVQSSNIQAIGYDPLTQHLAVRFASGDTYHYAGVPPHEHQALVAADSIGSHFHRHVRSRYEAKRT